MKFSLAYHAENVRTVIHNFFPVFVSRGVVQISAYIDAFLASWLPTGAVAALAYAQTLYTLPVSLGMSVSAAELPVMSGALGAADEVATILHNRLNHGLRKSLSWSFLPLLVFSCSATSSLQLSISPAASCTTMSFTCWGISG